MKPKWPAHIQREIDIDNGIAQRTWDEQKKAMGLFAYAVQFEANLQPRELIAVKRDVLEYFDQGGACYDELQPWMAERYLETLQTFSNYQI